MTHWPQHVIIFLFTLNVLAGAFRSGADNEISSFVIGLTCAH